MSVDENNCGAIGPEADPPVVQFGPDLFKFGSDNEEKILQQRRNQLRQRGANSIRSSAAGAMHMNKVDVCKIVLTGSVSGQVMPPSGTSGSKLMSSDRTLQQGGSS